MADHTTESCITLHPYFHRVRIPTYISLPDIIDVVWNYELPIGEMQAISVRLSLDTSKVTEQVV